MKTEKEIADVFVPLKVYRVKREGNLSIICSIIILFFLFTTLGFWDWVRGR